MQATSDWSLDTHNELKHTLATSDSLAVTAVKKNSWMEGFKLVDPDHTSLLFPSSAVRPVHVRVSSSPGGGVSANEEEKKPKKQCRLM